MASLKPLWLSVGSLSERLRRADSLHVGLDFDGTLIPISVDPREATLPVRAREVLERLSRQAGARLAILSSRTLDDLWRRIGIEHVFYAGSSGLETRDERGRLETHAGATFSLPMPLLRELEGWCQRFPGAHLEPRVGSCVLHFAGVAPSLHPAFGAGVRRRVRSCQSQVTLVHGRTGFEVMPADGSGQGRGTRALAGAGSAGDADSSTSATTRATSRCTRRSGGAAASPWRWTASSPAPSTSCRRPAT